MRVPTTRNRWPVSAGALLACIAVAWSTGAGALLVPAAVSAVAGAFVERWLFFAQARHLVTLYY